MKSLKLLEPPNLKDTLILIHVMVFFFFVYTKSLIFIYCQYKKIYNVN